MRTSTSTWPGAALLGALLGALVIGALLLPGVLTPRADAGADSNTGTDSDTGSDSDAPTPAGELAEATFAGGCFWCMEPPFDAVDGVISTTSGYAGGTEKDPTYEEVSAGRTGHAEAVKVVYDPAEVDYARLLEVFWHNVDPTVDDRQFCDDGKQYRTAVFYHDDEQQRLAEASKQRLVDSGRFEHVYTEVLPNTGFYPAEEYHQDFYRKNPERYHTYRSGCGRDQRLKELWGETAGH